MAKTKLDETIEALTCDGKGILCIDECSHCIQCKFDKLDMVNTTENRRLYRDMLLETPSLEQYISGVVMNPETYEQKNNDGVPFVESLSKRGILVGIKLDKGQLDMDYNDIAAMAEKKVRDIGDLPPETVKVNVQKGKDKVVSFLKEHSDFVKHRLEQREQKEVSKQQGDEKDDVIKTTTAANFRRDYREKVPKGSNELGSIYSSKKYAEARFSQFRCIIVITAETPTYQNIDYNTTKLAEFAKLSLEHEIVPIIELEVFFYGNYTIDMHHKIFKFAASMLFFKLNYYLSDLKYILLKIAFITDGMEKYVFDKEKSTMYLCDIIKSTFPVSISGILFLSSGHDEDEILQYLEEACKKEKKRYLTFAFCRALTNGPLDTYRGRSDNIKNARTIFIKNLKKCSAASRQKE